MEDSEDEDTLDRLNKEDAVEAVGANVELAVNEVVVDSDDDEEETKPKPKKPKKSVKSKKRKTKAST